ncbi:MAG: RBBP9/YdeN family alpha/beta hydrolase [Phycicoccus sp.]
MMTYVTVPGIGDSGPEHWHGHWEAAWGPAATRIRPSSWDHPELHDWLGAIDRAVTGAEDEVVLVAHSLGCLASAHWLSSTGAHPSVVRGAVLVAPPDPAAPPFPRAEAPTFVGLELRTIPVPTLVVASDDDPYADVDDATSVATAWGAGLVRVGRRGHLNSDSGLGAWPEGRTLVEEFVAGLPGGGAPPPGPGREFPRDRRRPSLDER